MTQNKSRDQLDVGKRTPHHPASTPSTEKEGKDQRHDVDGRLRPQRRAHSVATESLRFSRREIIFRLSNERRRDTCHLGRVHHVDATPQRVVVVLEPATPLLLHPSRVRARARARAKIDFRKESAPPPLDQKQRTHWAHTESGPHPAAHSGEVGDRRGATVRRIRRVSHAAVCVRSDDVFLQQNPRVQRAWRRSHGRGTI